MKFGDSPGDFLTDALSLTWFDQAQREFVTLFPLRRTKGFVLTANQDSFDIPAEMIVIEVVTVSREIRRTLQWVTPSVYERNRTALQDASGYPTHWTLKDGRLYVWPRFNTASLTTTVNASTTISASTITLASTGNLRTYGRAIIDSEEVEYTAKATTTITGVLRGVGGTNAATHISGASVTQVDFELFYPYKPAFLTSSTSPEIAEIYHEKLELYVLYLAHMAEGHVEKARHYYDLWLEAVKSVQYQITRRQMSQPMRVQNIDNMGLGNYWGI